jgi:hypothetical protein
MADRKHHGRLEADEPRVFGSTGALLDVKPTAGVFQL